MAHAGDSYIVELLPSHLGWGTERYTDSRPPIYGEGYIKIPSQYAQMFDVYNSNYSTTGLGYNLFTANSVDGYLQNFTLLAQGCSNAGDIYAKQFSVKGNLQIIGGWYSHMMATTKNSVRVTWLSPTEVELEII